MKFKDLNEATKFYAKLLYQTSSIKSTNKINNNQYKNELAGEIIQQYFTIENSTKVIGTYKNHKPKKWWIYGEILSEFLNLDPPIMYKYKPDLLNQHYKLLEDGRMQYTYSNRFIEFNQFTNIYNQLKKNPNSKRCVIDIFAPYDTDINKVDVPCTTMYHFLHRDNKLNMTVFMRSWDFFGGFKTYDVALSSFIQQSFCSWLNMEPGNLNFYVNSLHYYNRDREQLENLLYEDVKDSNEIILDKKYEINNFYKELRQIKLCEEYSYSKNFEDSEKIKINLNCDLFKDVCDTFINKNKLLSKNG